MIFDAIAGRLVLAGLQERERAAWLESPTLRRLVQYRLTYLMALHAPVLLLLLELVVREDHPRTAVLALGVASLMMAVGELPAGIVSDVVGNRFAITLGLRLMQVALVGFVVLAGLGALSDPAAVSFWAGAGVVALEAVVGLALAFVFGADSSHFRAVVQRERPSLGTREIEATGQAARFYGGMIAAGAGSLIYYGAPALGWGPSWVERIQLGLFIASALVIEASLWTLRGVPEEERAGFRPGSPLARMRAVVGALVAAVRALAEVPRGLLELTVASGALAFAMFGVYLFQAPLDKGFRALLDHQPLWLPGYALAAMIGYRAAALGSQRATGSRTARELTIIGGAAAVMLVALPSLLHLVPSPPPWLMFVAGALLVSGCNWLRGTSQTFARAELHDVATRSGAVARTSLQSVFNLGTALLGFSIAAVFHGSSAGVEGLYAVLSTSLLACAVALFTLVALFAFVPLISLRSTPK